MKFKLTDADGVEFFVDADRWVAGVSGVSFADERGKVVEFFEWNEIGDSNIVRVNG